MSRPPLALAHDYLTQRGGAERVVAAWCRAFPDAPLYTSLYEPADTFDAFRSHDIRTSWLNHISPLRQDHRRALPLLAPVTSARRIDADVVLASSSGWAHGVRATHRLVVYCHAPARWLYQRDRYLSGGTMGALAGASAATFAVPLTWWDRRAARRADSYIANSTFTQELIKEVYGRDAPVIPPPVDMPETLPEDSDRGDVLVVARLLPYKNVDVVLAIAAACGDLRFRIVGDGPLRQELTASAPSNVTFLGAVSDDDLWQEYTGTRVHLALSHEDFGITPLEAAAAGRPTVARRSGGYLDTITSTTGLLVPENTLDVAHVAGTIRDALAHSWSREDMRRHAASFSTTRHIASLRQILDA